MGLLVSLSCYFPAPIRADNDFIAVCLSFCVEGEGTRGGAREFTGVRVETLRRECMSKGKAVTKDDDRTQSELVS